MITTGDVYSFGKGTDIFYVVLEYGGSVPEEMEKLYYLAYICDNGTREAFKPTTDCTGSGCTADELNAIIKLETGLVYVGKFFDIFKRIET